MKFLPLLAVCIFISMPALGSGPAGSLIGSCNYDPRSGFLGKGNFRSGNVLANFYRVESEGEKKLIVTTGISQKDGSIAEKSSLPSLESDNFSTYQVDIESTEPNLKGFWKDREAAEAHSPMRSGFGFRMNEPLGVIQAQTAVGSYVQNFVVGRGNIYPLCVFWEKF